MQLRIYGIKNCNTMKKTFDFLESEGIEYEFVDYKKQAPDAALLVKFADKVGFESLINKRGTTYRKLEDSDKEKLESEKSALAVLAEKSSMIKRPIVEFPNGDLILGFEPDEIKGKM
ncbi:Spx/MgsR family RNA polymerase-binding regulatory protein [Belliella kenyensis]|uniref:Spx/MgsR family RNA polymerase-binding regulatory protein n=1 Tax=Belliella kenyensis TaxID=1472724 RepID=A0ABV8EIT0_9BACT|nr:Spx/MgsR family RNA polymerase-binding regulatory protein [Belliella kenyensis]MDN3602257.1 Spx/MgsR family RNA polymerase-binding regulatory protein [Belliella kenyensis]